MRGERQVVERGVHDDENAEQKDARGGGELRDISQKREAEDDDEQCKNGDVRSAALRMDRAERPRHEALMGKAINQA